MISAKIFTPWVESEIAKLGGLTGCLGQGRNAPCAVTSTSLLTQKSGSIPAPSTKLDRSITPSTLTGSAETACPRVVSALKLNGEQLGRCDERALTDDGHNGNEPSSEQCAAGKGQAISPRAGLTPSLSALNTETKGKEACWYAPGLTGGHANPSEQTTLTTYGPDIGTGKRVTVSSKLALP